MMVVDDLQWVDSSSLDLLLKVLVRCDNLLMVAAARDNQQTLLDYLSAALQQPKQILQINLHRFTASETTEFISSQVPEFACYGDVIYRESEGNPFFIAEMIRNLQAGIDINLLNQHMNDFIGSRVVGLSNSTKAIANMCAAIQGDISLELLSAVSGLRNIELVDLIEELLDKKILMEFRNIRGDIEFFFTHQKIREYIYNHISLSKRQIIHEKIAQGLENIFVRDQGNQTYYPRLIYHYTVSGNTYKMLYYRLKHLELILKPRHEIFPINPESTDIAITSYLHPEKDIDEELAELDGLLKHGHLHCNEEELNRLKMSYCFIYGRYNREKGNYQVGKLSLLRMLELARQAEDQHYLAEGYTQLILHAVDVYDLEMLESMIAEAAKVKYIQDSPDYAGNMLRLQGYLEIYREHYQLGEQLIHQAIAILEPVAEVKGWYFQLAAAYFCLGESRLRQGDTKGAEQHLLTAKEYC
ncbi:MAG: hypothetical protein RR051_06195, partial [Clostridiales bacterium]